MQRIRVLLLTVAILCPALLSGQEIGIDPQSGFRMTGDWQLVRANCIACHSTRLVTQQRATAAQWLSMIRWMQADQNLWQLDTDTESKIVAYLAENYPPSKDQRRAAISPDLMPPNPFAPEDRTPAAGGN